MDQPARQKRRRLKRKAKAQKIAPRPAGGALRPIVQCQTQRYNIKSRKGRGFTPMELKAAGINQYLAPTIGIAVDRRRKNRSQEGLDRNVSRLKDYMSRLVLFPRKPGKPKAGDASKEEIAQVTQLKGELMPIKKQAPIIETAEVTKEMQEYKARTDYRMQAAYAYAEAKKRSPAFGNDEE